MKRLIGIACLVLGATSVEAQLAGMQSPAYQECTALAASNPTAALAKADVWLKIDTGIAAQHCRAMALFGLHRYAEAGDALAAVRESIPPETIALRSYVARQAAQSYLNASSADKALGVLTAQINEFSSVRSDNVNAAKQTSNLLLDRARLHVTYGKLVDATKDLDHAVSLTPINEEVLIERAGVFEKLGDIPLARNDLDTVLAINANNNVAKNFRKRLSGKAARTAELEAPAANAPITAPAAPIEAPAAAAFTPSTAPAAAPQAVDTAVTPVTSSAVQAPATATATAPTALPFVEPTKAAPAALSKPVAPKPAVKKAAPAPAAATAVEPAAITAPALPLPSATPALPLPGAKPIP